MRTLAIDANPFARARHRLWTVRTVGAACLAAALALLWHFAHQHAVILRREEPVSVLVAVTPPPPPPPPPQQRVVPKEVIKEAAPVPQPVVRPMETSHPTAKNEAITENAPAQEGSDDFQIGAGDGMGLRGSGGGIAGAFNRGAYASYLAQIVQRAVSGSSTLRNREFRVKVSVWLSQIGKVTRAQLQSTTGSDVFDRELQALLVSLPAPEQPPPPAVLEDLPVLLTVDVKRGL